MTCNEPVDIECLKHASHTEKNFILSLLAKDPLKRLTLS
jgi:hypothetical protein